MRAALAYAQRLGWPVLPLEPGGKRPVAALAPHGVKSATINPRTIEWWWSEAPTANVGIACESLFVLDVDPRAGGDEAFVAMQDEHGPLPVTVVSETGGGGAHYLFNVPVGVQLRGKIAPGLDVKTSGGYIVAPPSIHPSGATYRWSRGRRPLEVPIADPPAWLVDLARVREDLAPTPRPHTVPRTTAAERARRWLACRDPAISGSGGHAWTFTTAQKIVRGFDLSEGTAMALLAEWNQRCQPPWSDRELRRKVEQAAKAGRLPIGSMLEAR